MNVLESCHCVQLRVSAPCGVKLLHGFKMMHHTGGQYASLDAVFSYYTENLTIWTECRYKSDFTVQWFHLMSEKCISWFYSIGHMSIMYRNITEDSMKRAIIFPYSWYFILFPPGTRHTVCSAYTFPPHCTLSVTQPITRALVLGRLMASLHKI